MDTISKEYKLQQWALAISEQKHSGLTINAWCEQNGIRRDQYFYRQKQVRKALAEAAGLSNGSAPTTDHRIFTEAAQASLSPAPSYEETGAYIHTAGVEICLTNTASAELVRNILDAVR